MVVEKAKNILPPRRKPGEKPNETPWYRLPLYNSGTYANLREGYNKSMQIIDRKLHEFDSRISLLENSLILDNNTDSTISESEENQE